MDYISKYQAAEKQVVQLQAEIDRLTAQNLQLRLIADRAVAILLGGEKPDQAAMNEDQISALAKYMDSVNYDDMEEVESAEDCLIKLMVKPLLEIIQQSPAETNLLELAMAEQNRKKLVDEEIQQLVSLATMRPQFLEQANIARHALHFARQAGAVTPKEKLFDMFSPCVMLARGLNK